mgnify:CR=1 FL=1
MNMPPVLRSYLARLQPLLANRHVFFLLFLLGYTEIAEYYGYLPSLLPAWRFEIPLLAYLYFFLNLLLRRSPWQPLLAAAPIFLLYGISDLYFRLFGRLLRIAEIRQLPEAIQVLSPSLVTLAGLLICLPLLAFLFSLDFKGNLRGKALAALPLFALVLLVENTPRLFLSSFQATQQEIVLFSDTFSARNNGRLGMMLYNEAKRKNYLQQIATHQVSPDAQADYDKVITELKAQQAKRNIHLIVLESFLDPTLLKGAQFSRNPVHPAFSKLFGKKGGFSLSPVFAGGTAQAEFEVLCGAPALREFSGIEFDVFTGAKAHCLPAILSEGGYATSATNSYKPDFFNSTNAYAGIGFQKKYYPEEFTAGYDTYFSTGDVEGEDYVFDGVLFSQNLAFMTKTIKEQPGKPIFNYLIGMYGHIPHDLNTKKRPLVLKMTGKFRDEGLEKSANQYYYRTEAIATFVKGLIAIDPRALIILVSDHLPSLTGENTYKKLGYFDGSEAATRLNRIYIVENGRPIRNTTIHHFDIPRIILNYATKGKYCQEHDCDFNNHDTQFSKNAYHNNYLDIMSQAMDATSPIRMIGTKTQCVQ